MAAGDLNRDGWPDLAIANADAHAVTLLISSGVAGSFRQVDYPMPGANPRGIALGDRDRDGALDVLVTEYATGAWRILYGDGAGAIAREERYGAIANPQGIVAADFNRDGWLDVAIAGTGINIVAVFYSTPAGGLQQRNVLVDGAVNVLAHGDFNRDGWLDLAAVSTSNSMIYTLLGGSGGLAWRGSTPSGSSPRGIAAGDVNHDGWVDLMTANRASSTVNVHLGMASQPGSFTSAAIVCGRLGQPGDCGRRFRSRWPDRSRDRERIRARLRSVDPAQLDRSRGGGLRAPAGSAFRLASIPLPERVGLRGCQLRSHRTAGPRRPDGRRDCRSIRQRGSREGGGQLQREPARLGGLQSRWPA